MLWHTTSIYVLLCMYSASNKPLSNFQTLRVFANLNIDNLMQNTFHMNSSLKEVTINKKRLGIYDKNYKWYAIYAWGIPLLVTLITIVMQYLPKHITQNCYTPGIDRSNCLLEPKWGMLFYFHIINGPVMVIEMIIVFLDQNVLMNHFCFKRLLLSFSSWKSFTFYL